MVLLNLYSKKFIQFFISSCVVTPAFAGVLPLFTPNYFTSQDNSFYVNLNTFLSNDPFTLKDLFNGIKTDSPHIKSGTNIALGNVRVDIGYNDDTYGYIGYTYREEVFFDTNKDTVELLYFGSNKKDLPSGKNYNLDLSMKAFEVQGIAYAKNFTLYHDDGYVLNIGFGLEALQGKSMQNGIVQGTGVINSSKDYSFDIVANYDYTHNYLYKLDVKKASAYGYSSHLSLYLKKDNFSLLFLANDLFAKLYWKNLPHSDVTLSSNNKVYDANGYVKYKPLASGYEGDKNYIQTLPTKYRAELAYIYKKYLFTLGSDATYGIYMPYFESDYKVASDFTLGLGYETRFKSVTLKSQYKNFVFTIKIDDIIKPTTAGLHISYLF